MLFAREQLVSRFHFLLEKDKRADIASAWIGDKGNLAFKVLDEAVDDATLNQSTVRVMVGISGNGTSPSALRRLLAIAAVRIDAKGWFFHLKLFTFTNRKGLSTLELGARISQGVVRDELRKACW